METYWVLRNDGIECRVAANQVSTSNARPVASGAEPRVKPRAAHAITGRDANGLSGLKLTGRGKGLVAAVALAITLPFASASAVAAASAPPPSNAQPYTVAAGESLWTIAERSKAPGADTRDQVARIKRLNHLHSSNIYAGQVILVDSHS